MKKNIREGASPLNPKLLRKVNKRFLFRGLRGLAPSFFLEHFGRGNVFRDIATPEQWQKHYANVAKKRLCELIKTRVNALADTPIF